MRVLTRPINGTVTVGTSSVEILPANSRRSWATISNSGAVGIWISLGETAVVGQGIYLDPGGGKIIINEDGLWRGAVNGIAASGSNVVGTVDLQ